jgi:hypothetical protein
MAYTAGAIEFRRVIFYSLIIYFQKSSHGFHRDYSTRYQSGLDLVLKQLSFSIVSTLINLMYASFSTDLA